MPLPSWLSTMAKSARIFYPYALAGVKRGLSANSVIQQFRRGGGEIRRAYALDIVRHVRGVEAQADVLKYLRKNVLPNPAKIPVHPGDILRDYSYRIGYQAVSDEGILFNSYVTVSTDSLITTGEAEGTALGFLEDTPEEYGVEEVTKIGPTVIFKSSRIA